MSIYTINPSIDINDDNDLKIIMDNLTNDISNLFITNKNLIIVENYKLVIFSMLKVLSNYLKLYKFYKFDVKNIYIQIYNRNIDVVLYIYTNISNTFYRFITSTWEELYFKTKENTPIVYDKLSQLQKDELRTSSIAGTLYFYDNIILDNQYNNGIILKKQNCYCTNTNCNINSNYIITVYW